MLPRKPFTLEVAVFVEVDGIRLAYDDQGTGIPMVFLHAFPMNRTMWAPQLVALSRTARVITVDLRGHGESDAPLWHYSMEQFAGDLCALLDRLSLAQAVFAGLSMGGYLIFSLLRRSPHRVKAIVLAGTRAAADSDEARHARFMLAQVAYAKGASAVAETMLPKLLGPTSLTSRPDLVERVRSIIGRTEVSGIAGDLMAMAERPDSRALLPTIACPALVIVGEEDTTTPLQEARLIADQIPGARLEIIPNAGHLSNLEQPEAFNRALERFVSSLR